MSSINALQKLFIKPNESHVKEAAARADNIYENGTPHI